MNDLEKVRVLLIHWIEHNEEHADEFRRWACKAGDAAPDVLAAAERMTNVNQALAVALEKLGGSPAVTEDSTPTKGHTSTKSIA